MIGVDIIDLSLSFNQAKYCLEDYKNKILNKAEFSFCKTYADLEYVWAMKESAYKCFFKKTDKSFLNPKRIFVTQIDWNLCTFHVRIEDEFYSGRFHKTDQYVYAICFDKENCMDRGAFKNKYNTCPEVRVFISSVQNRLNSGEELDFYAKDLTFGANSISKLCGAPGANSISKLCGAPGANSISKLRGAPGANIFKTSGAPKATFQLHSEGFPLGILLDNRQYGYSRSHHGSYYISAITPNSQS